MKIFVNLLTMARFFGILGLLAIRNVVSKCSFMVYTVVLLLTDYLDGMLARKFKVQTLYGSIMDTVADKVFSITLLIFLLQKSEMFWLILIGEVCIALVNVITFASGKKTASSLSGKIKMWILSISIICGYLYYFEFINNEIIIDIEIVITFTFQLLAMFGYIKSLINQKGTKRDRMKIENTGDLKYILFDTEYYLKSKTTSM